MFDWLFELAFTYRPVVFEQGEFAFSPPWPIALVAAAGLAAAVAALWPLRGARRRMTPVATAVLLALRLGVIAALVFVLARPVLVLEATVPQQNVLAVVMDDSRSMTLDDEDGASRGAFLERAFGARAPLRAQLADRFALRFYRFSAGLSRVAGPEGAAFAGTRSNLGEALAEAADDLAGLPAAGIVLVTDGADTSTEPIADRLRALRARRLPVFTVGVGRRDIARDVQIGRVEPPSRVLAGTTLVVDVVVAQRGFAGQTAEVVVEDEGQRVGAQAVTLGRDGEPVTARVRFTLAESGPRLLRFRVAPLPGEQVRENNQREALVVVENRRERILYIEGEPRFEMKFLRRAVADDRNLQVVTLQRTADRKFLRLDVDAEGDLAGGFPKTREELFAYRGLVLGSIEASAFTPDQLRMIADFVSVRGGGLLALGGRRALAEGGFAGTPVADALPLRLDGAAADPEWVEAITVRPTPLGASHVATQIAATDEASSERWAALPALTIVNPVTEVKPGAAVLLAGEGPSRARHVVLAYQRFGAGKAIAFAVQDSWLWQMHADIPVEDLTHETLWRRLLRWLVDATPGRIEARLDRERVEAGDTVAVTTVVRDAQFVEINDASPHVSVVAPSGREADLPLDLVLDRPGEYRGRFVASEEGLYEVRVAAAADGSAGGRDGGGRDAARRAAGRTSGPTPGRAPRQAGPDPADRDVAYLRAAPDDAEYFDAAMRAPLLERIAEETGGRFHTPATVAAMPEAITYLGRGVTRREQRDLWDMPAIWLVLVSLASAEWIARRRWGLA